MHTAHGGFGSSTSPSWGGQPNGRGLPPCPNLFSVCLGPFVEQRKAPTVPYQNVDSRDPPPPLYVSQCALAGCVPTCPRCVPTCLWCVPTCPPCVPTCPPCVPTRPQLSVRAVLLLCVNVFLVCPDPKCTPPKCVKPSSSGLVGIMCDQPTPGADTSGADSHRNLRARWDTPKARWDTPRARWDTPRARWGGVNWKNQKRNRAGMKNAVFAPGPYAKSR